MVQENFLVSDRPGRFRLRSRPSIQRELRLRQGVSQLVLAAELGISPATLSRFERRGVPSDDDLARVRAAIERVVARRGH